jgi:hypothetical protein
MANAAHRFKDRDIKRIVRSVRDAGEVPRRIEVDPHTGKVVVTVGEAAEAHTAANSWDEVIADAANPKRAP